MKQIIKLVILVVMSVFLITGCGGDANTTNNNQTSSEPKALESANAKQR